MPATKLPPHLQTIAQERQLGELRESFSRRPGYFATIVVAITILIAWAAVFAPLDPGRTRNKTAAAVAAALAVAAIALWAWVNVRRIAGGVYVFDHGLAFVIGRKVKWSYRWGEIASVSGITTRTRVNYIPTSKKTEYKVHLRNGQTAQFGWFTEDMYSIIIGFKRLANIIHQKVAQTAPVGHSQDG